MSYEFLVGLRYTRSKRRAQGRNRFISFISLVSMLGIALGVAALIDDHPEWNVHDYCKAEVRHDRKMGHITVLTDDTAKTVADLEATGCWDDLKKA